MVTAAAALRPLSDRGETRWREAAASSAQTATHRHTADMATWRRTVLVSTMWGDDVTKLDLPKTVVRGCACAVAVLAPGGLLLS